MQDKLIADSEEMAKALWVSWGGVLESPGWETFAKTELGENYRKGCLAVLAAVRAHDAGTDEELRKAIHILRTTPITPEHGFECGTERGVAFSTGFGHAIKILEKASASHAAESTAQLDAEDPAEPGEDVVSRMCELMGGCACEHCIKRMTAALAVAREGYYSQQDVEKAIRTAWARDWCGIVTPESFEQFLALIMARLAPRPSLREEIEAVLSHYCDSDLRCGTGRGAAAIDIAALIERRTK